MEPLIPEVDTSNIDGMVEKVTALKAKLADIGASLKETFGATFATIGASFSAEAGRWKTTFQTVFNDIITLGAPLKDWIINSLVPAWQTSLLIASNILAGLSESLRMVFESIWSAIYPIIELFVTQGLPRFTEFSIGVQELIAGLFDVVKQIFDDLWMGVVDPVMQLISKIIKDVLDIIFGWWDTWGKDIMEGLKVALEGIKGLWENLWINFLQPFVEDMLGMLNWLWDKHLKALVAEIATFVGKLIKGAVDIFNGFILPLVNFLVKILGPTFSNIFSLIGDVLGTAIGIIADVAKGIIKALGGVVDFIVGVFTGDFKRAWNGIVTFFEGIADGIVGIFKGAVNLIIDALNFMIRMLNNIKIDIPEWVSNLTGMPSSFGFKIGEIPKLDVGTNYVAQDGLAFLHEGEAVVPKKFNPALGGGSTGTPDNREMLTVLNAILQKLSQGNGDLVLQVDGTTLGRVAANGINDIARRTGRTPLRV